MEVKSADGEEEKEDEEVDPRGIWMEHSALDKPGRHLPTHFHLITQVWVIDLSPRRLLLSLSRITYQT